MARIKRRTIAYRNITKLRVNIKAPEVKINSSNEMMSIPDHGIQTEVVKKDASSQTYDYDFSSRINIMLKYLSFESVANLFCILTDSLNDWKSIHLRILSVSVYLILRLLNISFESSRDILTSIRMLNIQICHTWATTFIDEGNLCVILRVDRAKSYALTEMCRKECTFDAMSLAIFLDKRFRELYPEIEIETESLVRSVESCRVDLLKWGAKYESTFRSGATTNFRWIFPDKDSFFIKGRRKSIMIYVYGIS
ncbi:unnamed protein product [Brachionus calyciflorus]|uniref:Uncharacterized protein n=1 Tax=Brachionus calyciflorus TaxID=104777 RepID=A0A814J7A9_9BILA|nr:unnamed protein product [Brachionus calyciflorus]